MAAPAPAASCPCCLHPRCGMGDPVRVSPNATALRWHLLPTAFVLALYPPIYPSPMTPSQSLTLPPCFTGPHPPCLSLTRWRMLGLGEQSPFGPGPCPPSSSTRMGYSSHFPLAISWGHMMLRNAEPRVLSDWPWLETCGHRECEQREFSF